MAHPVLEQPAAQQTLAALREAIPKGQFWMDMVVFEAGYAAVESLMDHDKRQYPNAKHIVNLALAEILRPEPSTGETNA